ncbi:aminoglycoside phosphotransferase family protein [Streptomyces paromomycinus]|uniref:Aminoglycoside O-phosphotransferase n=1 Tax=Streptomyces paromomycinus TaxID=92743 RepID=A0A401WB44_STREY|nr:aminoglycoside phosphotransferase family protein [Streptomyces paromomycinus]GCD46547.1 aminoglycoside O-phosphotransferase [Streptomyces paromomycinus]
MRKVADVAPEVRDRLAVRFGDEVRAWCDTLPELVGNLTARWRLELVEANGGGTSRVFRCLRRDTGTSAWLKLTPEPALAREEAAALTAWAGTPSVVTLLAQDLEAGALLLEDVEPGVPVRRLDRRLPEVAALLRDLRAPAAPPGAPAPPPGAPAPPPGAPAAPPGAPAPPPGAPAPPPGAPAPPPGAPAPPPGAPAPLPERPPAVQPLAQRVEFLFRLTSRRLAASGTGGLLDPAVLGRARGAALDLASDGPRTLVHGDLHPDNVLSGPGARMVAIDPRPAWGDPDFDAVDWVLDGVTTFAALEERARELAALVPGQSPDRVLGWCRSLAVLNAALGICARRDDAKTRFLIALASA